MIWRSMTPMCAAAAIAALAACEHPEVRVAGFGDECTQPVGDLITSPMNQFVNGLPPDGDLARNILKNGGDLETAIENMGGSGPNLRAKIASVRASTFADGFAGMPVRAFLDGADDTLQGNGFQFPVQYETTGQIERYFFDGTDSSCLRVLMTTTATHGGRVTTVEYRWTVFASFQVAPRDNTDMDDVFPTANTIPITAAMAGAFNNKLWAKGTTIEVTRVEFRRNQNGGFKLLPSGHPLYRTTVESCIDMMFVGTPPTTLPVGAAPPGYCLGRCNSPPIINTK